MLEAVPCFLERRVCKLAWTPSGVECAVACSAVWAHEGCAAGRGAACRVAARCSSVGETSGAMWEPVVQVRERRRRARKRRGRCATGSWTGASDSALSLRGPKDTACARNAGRGRSAWLQKNCAPHSHDNSVPSMRHRVRTSLDRSRTLVPSAASAQVHSRPKRA